MKNKKPESFALIVGIFTIIGGIATVVATFFNNGDTTLKENNSGIINQNSGDIINQQGDNPILIQGDGSFFYVVPNESDATEKQDIIMSETSYMEYLNGVVEGDILFHYYNDYDGDGTCEMFALVGDGNSDYGIIGENFIGKIWYVNCDGAKEIESRDALYWSTPNVYLFGNYSFISFKESYGSSGTTYIWGVQNGTPYQPNISGKIHSFSFNQFNEIEGIIDDFDSFKCEGEPMMGHTWKPYYFYFDGKTFREYGGMIIDEKDLIKINGTDKILNEIDKSSYKISSILYRENGIININVYEETEYETKYKNINLRCTQDGFVFVPYKDDSYDQGIYKTASIPAIATYPKNFPY